MRLPSEIDPAVFDERYRLDAAAWLPAVIEVCTAHGIEATELFTFADGSNLVAAAGPGAIVKIFPPFHAHQWESERRVLPVLHGRLPVRVPRLLAEGARADGWLYVIVERLPGVLLESCWPSLSGEERAVVMRQIGAAMARAHGVPVSDLSDLPPEWSAFIREQSAACMARHRRQGMPEWLLRDVPGAVHAWASVLEESSERVILTGEYTPFNLLAERGAEGFRLSGMFDLGDAMTGPREYDLLGPSLFLCGGEPRLLEALFAGYGAPSLVMNEPLRMRLMTLAVLHRYANFDAQVRIPAWRVRARSLEELARLIWPDRAFVPA